MASENNVPLMRSPIYVWLKSEYLDAENYDRLGSTVLDYDGASWPLGILLSRDAQTEVDPRLILIDEAFDRHVKCAWRLPWKRSRVRIHTPVRRSSANFVVRNIGDWRGESEKYRRVASLIAGPRIAHVSDSIRRGFATTPFCLISQHRTQPSPTTAKAGSPLPQQAEIIHTDIVMFYTFETFIQECLAWDAHRRGVSADVISARYEHIYTNARPADAIPGDLSRLGLAEMSGSAVEWDRVVGRIRSDRGITASGIDPRAWRTIIFELRLQTHLMIALATACRGIFATELGSSPLVRSADTVPDLQDLATHWLGHVAGVYDHAGACEQLLSDLAELYRPARAGTREAASLTTAERSIEATPPPPLTARDPALNIDSFRLPLFEASLDDLAVLAWREEYQRIANSEPEV